ncbi:hypothetical protein G6F31_017969 [Rhizopus arrhizus]|nr:hypothetical protein G6F31_017969 [Rhizopus arrhizus]
MGAEVGALAIAVDLGAIAHAWLEESQRHRQHAAVFIRDAAEEPVAAVAVAAHDRHVVAHFAIEHAALLPVHRHVFDEAERLAVLQVVLGQVGGHLDRAVQHHVQRQLPRQRAGNGLAVAALQAEDAGGVVHRPGQHAGEHQVDLMLGRVRWLAPGVVLHAARAFARDPVRVGAGARPPVPPSSGGGP